MNAPSCRFCLSGHLDQGDIFLSPCSCKGSLQYVHKSCLQTWRKTTQDLMNKHSCTICKSPYNLPRRWQQESVPIPGLFWTSILSNIFYISILVHYIHMHFLVAFTSHDIFLDARLASYAMQSSLGLSLYYFILASFTIAYTVYMVPYYKNVRNPWQYAYYGFIPYMLQLISMSFCLYLSKYTIFPFGAGYIACLERLMAIHIQTIEKINMNGIL